MNEWAHWDEMRDATAAAGRARAAGGPATSHDYHNTAHYRKRALERAMDALRKIALNHPCDLHDRIAALAVEDVETILAGATPPRRDLSKTP